MNIVTLFGISFLFFVSEAILAAPASKPPGPETSAITDGRPIPDSTSLKIPLPFELAILTGGRSGKLISDRLGKKDTAEISGSEMFLGLRFKGNSKTDEAGRFFYNLDAGLLALARESSKKSDGSSFMLLPGNELNAGVTFCPENLCGLSLGRSSLFVPGSISIYNHSETFVGGHGPKTGASIFFRGPNISFIATPILLPGYSGSTWSDNGLPRSGWQSGAQDARGFHAESIAMFDYFGLTLHYSGINQKQTARINGNSRDRIEYTGVAFLVRKPEGFLRTGFSFGCERSSGRYLAMDRDENGSSMVTIDGLALSSALDLKIENFSWETNFFLPEPQTRPRGSRKSNETAGYVGYGGSILDSPALGELLSATPFPVLCPGEDCAGIDRSDSPSHFRNQAGVLRTRATYKWSRFNAGIGGTLFRPLAGRQDNSGNPFQKLKKATNVPEFREVEASLSYEFSSGRASISYGRLWMKTDEKSAYGGESIQLSLMRSL